MLTITFIAFDGTRYDVTASDGMSLMQVGMSNSIPGIDAECGGACACATCHVYIDEAWVDLVGPPEPMEEDMLDFAYEPAGNSRLSCQVDLRPELDGLVVRLPERQA